MRAIEQPLLHVQQIQDNKALKGVIRRRGRFLKNFKELKINWVDKPRG